MKYFLFSEIVLSLIAFVSSGAVLGILYAQLKELSDLFLSFLKEVFKYITSPFYKIALFSKYRSKNVAENPSWVFNNIYQFLFFSLFFVLYILISYAVLDGAIRFYTLLIYIISFALFSNFAKRVIGKIFAPVFAAVLLCAYYLIFVLLIPAKLVFSIVAILLKLLKNHLAKKSMMSISEKIKRQKLKEIHFFLKNAEFC